MWGRGRKGAIVLTLLSARVQSLSPLPTIKLCPSGAASHQVGGRVHVLGPCGSLQQTLLWGWELLLLPPQPPRVFSTNGLRVLEPWVVGLSPGPPAAASLASHSLAHPAPQSYHLAGSSSHSLAASVVCPSCLSPSLLLVWMNVSSLSPWLLRTSMQFYFLSVLGFFCF